MAFIRSIEHIANKFATVTPQRTEDYRNGVQNPRKDWATSTAAAESAYETGVQLAITKKRFGKGVKKAGTEKWQRGAVEKGTQRWGPGVAMARNLDRVKAVVNALIAAKEQRLGK